MSGVYSLYTVKRRRDKEDRKVWKIEEIWVIENIEEIGKIPIKKKQVTGADFWGPLWG